ncbi:hypothetical protein [Mycobacterium sp. IDR2000157661]|uniref:hypothetical protein n=1 Tax=Mycobacterium sp. IDR2000157661 TaxID=2867005 RepID=UPI001EEC1E43|nr:hypothetical protein [Mycobacterium sp. IDR2000157661]ULE31371.1 hypothetical protein K3G64_14100 [Mycobacterium sp. IDR2000157661]
MTLTFGTFALDLLAQDTPRNTGPDFGKASPFGLLVLVLLLIGTFLLVRSMNKHLRKVPESFDEKRPEPGRAPDDGATGLDGQTPADGTTPDSGGAPREPG